MPRKIKIGIIGGTGLDDPSLLKNKTEKYVKTPFGDPSDALIVGEIGGVECVLLARHGRKHSINPTNVNFRANIHALKAEGCTHVIVTTACGSLIEDATPGDIVVLDQFIDRTSKRALSFYDGTVPEYSGVAHIPMGQPFCPHTRQILIDSLNELGLKKFDTGTIIVVEGPRFSTKAESLMFRQWGGTVISMTTVPEVCLAKEAGLCYASAALVTDYDCWKEGAESVTVDFVAKTMKSNAIKARDMFLKAIPKMAAMNWDDILAEAEKTAKSSIM